MVSHAASVDARINVIATIDYNICSGVSRTAKELMSDIIIFGWPHKHGFIDRMINDATESIVNCTSKTTLICHFTKPIALHRRIVVICPPFAEKEKGFDQWVGKISILAQELSIPILFHCEKKSRAAVIETLRNLQSGVAIGFESYKSFHEWEKVSAKTAQIRDDDILVFVGARPESVSYKPVFDQVPDKLEALFSNISKIVLYPAQFESRELVDGYGDIVANPFSFSRSAVQRIGRELGGFINKSSLTLRKKRRGA
jgi:hypothetical protein